MRRLTRRDFLALNAASLGALSLGVNVPDLLAARLPHRGPSLVDVDFDALTSLSDLHYLSPVEDPASGLPIGNGRMGTFVWTTPNSIAFQLNRVDVYGANRDHMGRFLGPGDHCSACGAVTVEFDGQPFAKSDQFHQHLSLYRAECNLQGQGVRAQCFVSADTDVLVLEIDDQRPNAKPVRLTLTVWGEHWEQERPAGRADTFALSEVGDTHIATRAYNEGDFASASALAVRAISGRATPDAAATTPTSRTFFIERPASGKMVVHISSAGFVKKNVDVAARSVAVLDETAKQSYEALRAKHREWWARFWRRGPFLSVQSADGLAEFMQHTRAIHLYVMASTARGTLPPKWNDMLFSTQRDTRMFGAQFWAWTMEPLYMPLFAAGAQDLADPYFNMYVDQLPQARIAAHQRFNAKGAHFPEISPFDGPRTFPDDVAKAYRDIYLGAPDRKPLTDRARQYGWYDIGVYDFALNGYVIGGHYTQASHIFMSGPRIAMHAWWRYRHTGDKAWLKSHAYPLLRDGAEFYRSFVVKDATGRYHMPTGSTGDGFMGVKNSVADIAAIRGIVPLARRAAEILGVDAELRAQWQEFLEHLAPLPMGRDPESKAFPSGVLADDAWSAGHLADVENGSQGTEDVWQYPIIPFENVTLETTDPEMLRVANETVSLMPQYRNLMSGGASLNTTARTPISVARLGRGEELPLMLASYYCAFPQRPNGFSPFESGANSVEHIAINMMAMQEALLQSISPTPGEPEVLRVFPAWPAAWDATYTLQAQGGFRVTSSRTKGVISFVEIVSERGEPCRIRNPWKGPCVLVAEGKKIQRSDDLIQFPTAAGQTYLLYQAKEPAPVRIAPKAAPAGPVSFSVKRPTGDSAEGTLGRGR